MKKRIGSLALSLALVLSLLTGLALAADLPFTDVSAGQWYFEDVKNAYENGLINGKTPKTFAPNDNLTYAEAVKLAACMNQRYLTGSVTLTNGEPWYQSYVDYCKNNKIITRDYSWNSNATRAGYMEIFADALPKEALKAVNTVEDGAIPDVPMSNPQAPAIYKLYRAGILQGNDLAHNCNPGAAIRRSEVAAILTRMMDSSKRLSFTMGEANPVEPETPEVTPLTITAQPQDVTVKVGEKAVFTVAATGGTQPYTYQWQVRQSGSNWVSIPSGQASGMESNTLTVQATGDNKLAGKAVRCVVVDAQGQMADSNPANLTILAPPTVKALEIVTQPEDQWGDEDDYGSVTVAVTGGEAPYTYTWEYKESDGTWNSSLDTSYADNQGQPELDVVFDHSSPLVTNKFRCTITDAAGRTVHTQEVQLHVNTEPLTVVEQPTGGKTISGDAEEVTLHVAISGGVGPFHYVWKLCSDQGKEVEVLSETQAFFRENTAKMTLTKEMFSHSSGPVRQIMVICEITDGDGTTVQSGPVSYYR